MMKPDNIFKPGSIKWDLLEDDWSDLTVKQIAEALGVSVYTIYHALHDIEVKTGYVVPHKKGVPGLKKGQELGPFSEETKAKMSRSAKARIARSRGEVAYG